MSLVSGQKLSFFFFYVHDKLQTPAVSVYQTSGNQTKAEYKL